MPAPPTVVQALISGALHASAAADCQPAACHLTVGAGVWTADKTSEERR